MIHSRTLITESQRYGTKARAAAYGGDTELAYVYAREAAHLYFAETAP